MPKTHAQLSLGANNNTVKELQTLLNEKYGAGLQVDGIFGSKTDSAVREYQKANDLQVDGIVGPKTWASLLAEQPAEQETLADRVAEAGQAYEDFAAGPPQDFAFDKQALLDMAEQAYRNRETFAYDPSADALYQQYKDRYTAAGRMAMEDTMGKAATLTGGYGNSYAQTAGQQAYQGYLQQLNEQLPELYKLAYSRYAQEGEQAYENYQALLKERSTAYAQHLDKLGQYEDQKKDLYSLYQEALSRQDQAYTRLYNLIRSGYTPTDRDLRNAGMTRAMANAIAAA